jgi:cysteine desulfurase
MERIYLDWNATAPLLPEVREAMVTALDSTYANASSIHRDGQAARSVVERARRAVAKAVSAPPQAVVLTGGATESNNQVIRDHVRVTDDPFVVCSAVEHPSVLEVIADLDRAGVPTRVLPVDRVGRLQTEALQQALADGASLVSVMWANNEIGNLYPVEELAATVHEAGALLHVDGTQALGRIPIDFDSSGIDFMSLSFHKMGGPKGIGAIVVREGLKVGALLSGGHQERGRRPGTENVPAAAGLEAAAKLVLRRAADWNGLLEAKREVLVTALREAVADVEFRGDQESRIPNTLNLAFPGVDGEDALLALDLEGVSMSSGSACTAGSLEPSHVVLAMGFVETDARRSVRLSFGPTTPDEHLVIAAQKIGRIVDRLRNL